MSKLRSMTVLLWTQRNTFIHKRIKTLMLFVGCSLRTLFTLHFCSITDLSLKFTLNFADFSLYLSSHALHPRMSAYFGYRRSLNRVELKDFYNQVFKFLTESTTQLIISQFNFFPHFLKAFSRKRSVAMQ